MMLNTVSPKPQNPADTQESEVKLKKYFEFGFFELFEVVFYLSAPPQSHLEDQERGRNLRFPSA
jgi:hypothetical protein